MGRKDKLRKVFSHLVNLNQFYTYGRNWFQIPFTFVTIMSSIGIIIIYFKVPQNPELLIALTILATLGIVGSGATLFKVKAQQRDRVMDGWRNPLPNLFSVALALGYIEMFKQLNVPVPKQLHKWGIQEWDDAVKVIEYVLKVGEDAYALPICQKFFEEDLNM